MAGTEMLRIADLSRMEVLVDVNEMDIIRLSAGDTATIEIDAYPNRKFTGTVTHVANSSKNSGGTITADQATNFEVKVNIDPASYAHLLEESPIPLRPGMSATVSICTIKKNDIITIPLQSITTRKGLADTVGNSILQQVFVYDSTSRTVKVRCIETGIQDMNRIEVLSGLDTACRIVTAPYTAISRDLYNGSQVRETKQ
jgi:HlyD family secretion protein